MVAAAVTTRPVEPIAPLELTDAVGAIGFALIGGGGLVFGLAALHNFLGYGISGSLFSGGVIPLANTAVGLEVAGAVGLLVGIGLKPLGVAAAGCLVVYFVAAIGSHLRKRDLIPGHVVPAVVMLVISAAALALRLAA